MDIDKLEYEKYGSGWYTRLMKSRGYELQSYQSNTWSKLIGELTDDCNSFWIFSQIDTEKIGRAHV